MTRRHHAWRHRHVGRIALALFILASGLMPRAAQADPAYILFQGEITQVEDPAAGGRITKLNADGSMATGFPKTYAGGDWDRGIMVRPHDKSVWIAHSGGDALPGDASTVARLDNNDMLVATIQLNTAAPSDPDNGQGPTGLATDANGQVWVTCFNSHTLKRINPATNTVTRTIDLNSNGTGGPTPAVASSYNYSDMTGITALSALKWGMWTAIHDSEVPGARWTYAEWRRGLCVPDREPEGTRIRVQLRAADSEAGLTREPFVDVPNAVPLSEALIGQFAQVRVLLKADPTPGSTLRPVLCNLILYNDGEHAADCNANGVPDRCEFDDCNQNCIPDDQEHGSGRSADHDGDGVPDCCQPTIFVDADAPGPLHDGSHWAYAFTNLEDALVAAELTVGATDRIWVAQGIYEPTAETDLGEAPSATFRLRSGVAIYGGFAGTEDPEWFDLGRRDFVANETILSGDLAGNDLANFVNYDENAFHVVTGSAVDNSSILDGFTISGGNANGTPGHTDGAGLLIQGGSPTIRNCVFWRNQADISNGKGGGVAIGPTGVVSLVNCLFSENKARYGGGLDIQHAEATLTNCTLSANTATRQGGAIEVSYVPGSVQPQSSFASVRNCVLWGNTAQGGPQIANSGDSGLNQQSTILIDHSDISGGTGQVDRSGGGTLTWGAGNIVGNPAFAAGSYRLTSSSPCRDAGNNAVVPAEVLTDLDGNARVADGDGDTIATVDMGPYEYCHAHYEPLPFPMDWEPDCDVDLVDFVAFQGCALAGVPADAGCLMLFDRALPCGIIDQNDFGVFALQISDDSPDGIGGPGPGCGEAMMGGEGEASAGSQTGDDPMEGDGSSVEVADQLNSSPPAAQPWALVELPIGVEVRALGGGALLTALAPGQVYEVHYVGATQPVQGYLLSISCSGGFGCVASASPAMAGAWSETGLFTHLRPGAEGLDRHLVLDDRQTAGAQATGPICGFVTGSAGELTLHLRMYGTDPVACLTYEMTGTTTVLVSATAE